MIVLERSRLALKRSVMSIKKVTTNISQNEGLIFEVSRPGRTGYSLPALDVPEVSLDAALPGSLRRRDDLPRMPEVSEVDVVRHFTRMSTWNYGIDHGLFPLGSCTMKYNPKINELVARMEGFARAHPYWPDDLAQGNLELIRYLEKLLCEITGLHAASLQPAAGAHGELTGLMIVKKYHASKGSNRTRVLVPDSAHGTNPASAAICGYRVTPLPSNAEGGVDLDTLSRHMDETVAALMLTNPSTLGIFEEKIQQVTEIVHAKGGLVYMDGANMNALLGITQPGRSGIDVMHLNLHKTFSTPHGGGGPGSGPVVVAEPLEPFLPLPRIMEDGNGALHWEYDRPHSIGRVRAFYGNFGMLTRALAYILTLGREGLREASESAVLNANYIARQLNGVYSRPFSGPVLHEVVLSDKNQQKHGVKNSEIAKRLMDYGFHPPTMSFPLIAHGSIMIEPTESESRQELDLFVDAMKSIAHEAETDPELVRNAPHTTRIGRLDETAAARNPVLTWKPED